MQSKKEFYFLNCLITKKKYCLLLFFLFNCFIACLPLILWFSVLCKRVAKSQLQNDTIFCFKTINVKSSISAVEDEPVSAHESVSQVQHPLINAIINLLRCKDCSRNSYNLLQALKQNKFLKIKKCTKYLHSAELQETVDM